MARMSASISASGRSGVSRYGSEGVAP